MGPMGFIPWHTESLTEEMLDLSRKMKSLYPAYLASLNLKLEDGSLLTASKMQGAIEELVKASVNKALASGMDVPNLNESWTLTTGPLPPKSYLNKWLTHDGSKATNINYEEFLRFVAATAPLKAFRHSMCPELWAKLHRNPGKAIYLDRTGLCIRTLRNGPGTTIVIQAMVQDPAILI